MAESGSSDDKEDDISVDAIIWIDANVTAEEENRKAHQQLQNLFKDIEILVFQKSTDCEEYVQQYGEKSFLIIVSRQLAQELIEKIHYFESIKSIYIYCRSENWEEPWMENFAKISGIFNKMYQLVNKIELDQKRMNTVKEQIIVLKFDVNNQGDSTLGTNGEFVHFRLLIEFLQNMDWTRNDKNKFQAFWAKECSDNISDRGILDEFMKTYSSDRVLWWYTRQTFFYNALNKALRQQKIEILLHMRFFINNLCNQLHELQRVQPQTPIQTYRGQLISTNELALLKTCKNESILMKSFLSTTIDRNLALFLLTDTAQQLERWHVSHKIPLERVLFIINADSSKSNDLIPFANISSMSYFPEEQETLFMAGSIFRIVDIRFDENEKIHLITMEFCDIDVETRKSLLYRTERLGEDNSFITLGHITQEMGRLDLAEIYYHQSLNEISNNEDVQYSQENTAVCYNSLGNIAEQKRDYEKSLEWFQKALDTYKQVLPANHDYIADCYRSIGEMHTQLGNTDQARESLEKAVTILKENHGEMYLMVAFCLNGIGNTYLKSKNIHDVSNIALEFFQKALKIKQQILPENDISIAVSLDSIGNLYRNLEKFYEAITVFEQSLEVKLKSIPKSHPTIIESYRILKKICQQNGDHEKAFKYTELMAYSEVQSVVLKIPDCINVGVQLPDLPSNDSST